MIRSYGHPLVLICHLVLLCHRRKCASRSHSRARRKKIKAEDKEKYEAEKKKGRERARKSYEKSTPPGSKPARNPSKYKDSTED